MPFKWEPPELFLEHHGVKVYRTYKDGDPENESECCFTTDPKHDDCTADSEYIFDYNSLPDNNNRITKEAIIADAIANGLIPVPPEERVVYEVEVPEVHYSTYRVEAPRGVDSDVIRRMVDNEDNTELVRTEFSHTKSMADWQVKEVK